MTQNNHHAPGEAPHNHSIQIALFIFFIIVWILDSFIFRITALIFIIPFYLTIIPGIGIIIAGLYLNSRSHIVFETPKPMVVDTGVYAHVRHPMYLSGILIYMGLWITTLSLLTLIPLFTVFIVYNYLASAEEHILEQKLGDEYLAYKKRVSKWIPH